jgi:hypothetical protein
MLVLRRRSEGQVTCSEPPLQDPSVAAGELYTFREPALEVLELTSTEVVAKMRFA